MSLAAMLWALNEAPVDEPTKAFILVALADNAWDDGRGAYPSVPTIARRARCSERTVQRHLRELEDAGVITRGDQRLAERFGQYRPVVYDLNLTLVRPAVDDLEVSPEPVSEAPDIDPNQGCQIVTPDQFRGDTGVTSQGCQSVTADEPRGDTEDPSGVTPVSPNPSTNPPTPQGGSTTSTTRARTGPTPRPSSRRVFPDGWDEFGPLTARCEFHRDAASPTGACVGCQSTRERFEVAQPKRDQARRLAEGREATERDRADRAAAAKVDAGAMAKRARKSLHRPAPRPPQRTATKPKEATR